MTFKEILLKILREQEEEELDKDQEEKEKIPTAINPNPPQQSLAKNQEEPKEDPNLVDPNKVDLTPIDPGPGQEPEPEEPDQEPQLSTSGSQAPQKTVDTISKEDAKFLIKNTKGRFFEAEFVKKNGTLRKINARLGVKAYLHGGSLPYNAEAKGLIPVFDVQKRAYRMINLNTLKKLKIGNEEYVVGSGSLKEDQASFSIYKLTLPNGDTYFNKVKNINGRENLNRYKNYLAGMAKNAMGTSVNSGYLKAINSIGIDNIKIELVGTASSEEEASAQRAKLMKGDIHNISKSGTGNVQNKEKSKVFKVPKSKILKSPNSKEFFINTLWAETNLDKNLLIRIDFKNYLNLGTKKYSRIKNINNMSIYDDTSNYKGQASGAEIEPEERELIITPETTIEDIKKFFGK